MPLNTLDIEVGNREIRRMIKLMVLEKAEITSDLFTAGNGGMVLPHKYALQWIRLLGDNTSLVKTGMVEFYEFRGNESDIDMINLEDMVLYPQTELDDHRYYIQPTMTQKTVSPQWFSGKFVITDQSLNIAKEGKDLWQVMLQLAAMKQGNEYEKLIIHGNKLGPSSQRAKAYTDYDPDKYSIDPMFIKIDGIITIAMNEGTAVDVSSWTTKYFNPQICKEMLMAIDEDHAFLLPAMQFMVSPRAYEDFYEYCENKGVDTASLQWILGNQPIQYHQKMIHGITQWENNPKQVKVHEFSDGGTVALGYPPVYDDSEILIPNTGGTFYTPYVQDTDYTITNEDGVITHAGTATSSIPTDSDTNITYRGPGVAVMTVPKNFKLAVNTDTVKIETDRVVNDAYDLFVTHTSCDLVCMEGARVTWANLENKVPE